MIPPRCPVVGTGLHGWGCTDPSACTSQLGALAAPQWRQPWPCWGTPRGDLPGHRLFSEAFIGVSLLLQAQGCRAQRDTKLGGGRTRTHMAASTAGGDREPQDWLQGCWSISRV